MGNFHCIQEGCAKVVYQEYLPPVVRWRYEGEEWQEINGDDFTLVEGNPKFVGGQCPGVRYQLQYWALDPNNSLAGDNSPLYRDPPDFLYTDSFIFNYPIVDIELVDNNKNVISYAEYKQNGKRFIDAYNLKVYVYLSETNPRFFLKPYGFTNSWGIEPYGFIALDPEPENCVDCVFTVYKDGEIIHEETRLGCPEVEQLNCRLTEEIKEIRIDKFPFLERVEVVPYAYQNFGLNVFQAIIPDHCLNIYQNNTTTIVPQFEGFPTPTNSAQSNYGFVAQICSVPDCPPPEYTVICDCDSCESCPDGTCAKECGDHICCYDMTTGKSIKSIPLDSYCGGNS